MAEPAGGESDAAPAPFRKTPDGLVEIPFPLERRRAKRAGKTRRAPLVDLRDPFKGGPNPPEFADMGDCTAYFTRYASDHHALVFYNHRFRMAGDPEQKRFWPGNTINQITWQVLNTRHVGGSHTLYTLR